ncbi:MAG TPA: FtsX-like permease family protein [Candidatus Rifleibacterium sp.]|nr:FtsX-like permease family protein [Candidatus Rifleibacterium sp.]HPT46691.1 FtsX-like permease family protein [Candidatus Rifleibacterium sp.]
MLTGDVMTCALRELKQNPRRTLAVVSGYAITVAFLLVIAAVLLYSRVVQNITIGEAGTYFATWLPACGDIASLSEEDLAKLARGIVPEVCKSNCENCTGCNKKPIDLLNEGFIINTNTTRLLTVELAKKIGHLPTVRDASACLMFRFRDPEKSFVFAVAGLQPGSRAVSSTCCAADDLVAGDFAGGFTPGRMLVDAGFAMNHGLKPGMQFSIAGEQFTVAGTVNTMARTVKADVFMLFSEAERLINRRIHNPLAGEANIILIESRDAASHGQALKDVKVLMKGDSLLTSGCYYPAAKAAGLNTRLVHAFMLLVALATVLFSARIQWASVLERRRTIAILKAIGWKNQVVIQQLFVESLLQSLAGSLAGAVVGAALLLLLPVNALLGIDATMTGILDPVLFLLVLAFAVGSGCLTGLLPVIAVIRQRPVEALRRLPAS